MSLTPEQKKQRLNFVTGSDAAIICGTSPWGNIIDLWQQKIGLAEAEDISDKPFIKAGNYLEPVVAQWFSDETGKLCEVDINFQIHKSLSWMGGNIDRRISNENAILECKTTSRDDNWGDSGDNTIPDYYLLQCVHYAAVCDVDRAYIAVLIRGSDFRWYTYERNAKLEELLIAKEKAFWECVQNEIPPEPRTADEVISLYSIANNEEPLISDDAVEQALMVLKDAKVLIKTHEKLAENAETIIKSYMKNHDTLYDRNGKIICSWKNAKGATRFDAKTFENEHKELYEMYLKQSESTRRFLIK